MRSFQAGQTVVRRDVHRCGRVCSEQALWGVADTSEALLVACAPGAETRWPALYAKARADGDRSARIEAFNAMATGEWELTPGVWQDTELLLWKPPARWFSINAFYTTAGLRNSGPFADADAWAGWRWELAWPVPRLPRPAPSTDRAVPTGG